MMNTSAAGSSLAASAMFGLSGRIALVTGGGRGIGRAIATGLAMEGAEVIVCGRALPALEAVVSELRGQGFSASAFPMDVAKEEDVARVRNAVLERFGGIDILVNNAAIDPHYASIEKTTNEQWDEIIAVNLTGVFRCCRLLGETMLRRKRGSIVNITSIGGRIGLKRQVPYCASKGGVEQLTKTLAHDWAEHGVRVNSVAYGYVKTDLTAKMMAHEHLGPKLLSRIPLGRFAETSEVSGAVVFLASDAASYVTGHSLVVDGGWTAV